ncbi:hypothetical protein MRB53_030714 [Persea americana]|uniref:Uncharacterized protein n=1 Tax=Persea americana TaxID=3435 RepID=A0ACC2KM13_PERAE|nr:hypothetical protein MRB53_030714 [Persea americana]
MFRLGVKTASNESNENAERLIQGRSNAFVVRNKRRIAGMKDKRWGETIEHARNNKKMTVDSSFIQFLKRRQTSAYY